MLERNATPQFCIITPTAHLRFHAEQSSMHLVLAHLVDTDKEYAKYYATNSKFKIMDNGAFELGESYAPEKLVELAQKCKADAIVLPDYPGQPAEKTIEAAIDLIPQVKDAGFATFFCPQAPVGEINEWIDAYTWGAKNDNIDIIGMSILAIPNALPYIPKAYARVVMTQILIDRGEFNFEKYHHYLGLNAGPNLELPALIKMNAMDSCDSSNPVWMGILGHRYSGNTDSFLSVAKVKKEVDFDYPLTTDKTTLDNIQHNINMTLELMK